MLSVATITTAVCFKNFLQLPPALAMLLGMGYLQIRACYLQRSGNRKTNEDRVLDSFRQIARDRLLFFFGIIFAVGGLGVLGYLMLAPAKVIIGVLSAIVDNIPLMFAVLTMDLQMTDGQWR